eukprot:1837723-Rhodomonas_salina.3
MLLSSVITSWGMPQHAARPGRSRLVTSEHQRRVSPEPEHLLLAFHSHSFGPVLLGLVASAWAIAWAGIIKPETSGWDVSLQAVTVVAVVFCTLLGLIMIVKTRLELRCIPEQRLAAAPTRRPR